MNDEKRQQRLKIRAGYGQQPWIKIIAFAMISGIRWRVSKVIEKIKTTKQEDETHGNHRK